MKHHATHMHYLFNEFKYYYSFVLEDHRKILELSCAIIPAAVSFYVLYQTQQL